MIRTYVLGADRVASSLVRVANVEVGARVERAVRVSGQLLRTKIKAHASGRPGPNAPTGDYRRSWGPGRVRRDAGRISVEVGTNAPQGRRLEYGFHGVDSLGRHYDQQPYPHVGPAVQEIRPEFARRLEQAVAGL